MNAVTAEAFTERFHRVISREFGPLRNAAKILGRAASVNAKTAANWLSGANAPRVAELFRLAQENDAIAEDLISFINERRNNG